MTTNEPEDEKIAREADAIVERIRPLLAGNHPGIQGCVLVELTAIWLSGHVEAMRAELMDLHVATVWELVRARDDYERAKARREAIIGRQH